MFPLDYWAETAVNVVCRRVAALAGAVKHVIADIGREMSAYAKIIGGALADAVAPLWGEFGPFLQTRTGAGAALMKVAGLFGICVPHPQLWITVVVLLALSVGFCLTLIGRKNALGPLVSDRDIGRGIGRNPNADPSQFFIAPSPAGASDPGFSAAHAPAEARA